MAITFKLRRDTKADWESVNPVLANGEPGVEVDTNRLKIGDGSTSWNNLDYVTGVDIENSSDTISNVHDIVFQDNLEVVNNNDGSVTVNSLTKNVDIEDSGVDVISNTSGINFGDNLNVVDDGDGSVTIDASKDTRVNVEDDETSISLNVKSINFGSSLVVIDDGDETVTVNASTKNVDIEDSGVDVISNTSGINFGDNLNVVDDGDGSVTVDSNNVSIEDSGSLVITNAASINFGDNLNVTDDGYGSITVDSPAQGVDIEEEGTVVVSGTSGVNFGSFFDVTSDGDGSVSVKFSENWTQISSAYTASATERILADTSSGVFTITLPASPTLGDAVWFADSARSWATNNLTVDGNGNNILGNTSIIVDVQDWAFGLVYNGIEWVFGGQSGAAASGSSGIGVEDDGTVVVENSESINFGNNLFVTDDGDGSITVDSNNVSIEDNGSLLISDAASINFGSNLDVTDDGNGSTTVDFSENWTQVSGAYTASATERILADTSGGALTITLLSSPEIGDTVRFADSGRSWGTNNLTIDGNGNNILGSSTFIADTTDRPFSLVYNGTQWILATL